MARLSAHGLAADLPAGWDGSIYVREPEVPPSPPGSPGSAQAGAGADLRSSTIERTNPVLHLTNAVLPAQRGDFGGGAVERLTPTDTFVSLFEHEAAAAGTPLFEAAGPPWPVAPDAFSPNRLQRPLPGQAGGQWFFSVNGRPFCLYVVLGSYLMRAVLVPRVNQVLATIEIS